MYAGSAWTTIAPAITSTNFNATNLTNGYVYYFRVTAYNSAGSSAAVTAAISPFGPANAPVLTSADVFGSNVLLKWSAPTNLGGAPVLRYRIAATRNGVTTYETTTSTYQT